MFAKPLTRSGSYFTPAEYLPLSTPLGAGIVEHAYMGDHVQTHTLQSSQQGVQITQQIIDIRSRRNDALHPRHLVEPLQLALHHGCMQWHSDLAE